LDRRDRNYDGIRSASDDFYRSLPYYHRNLLSCTQFGIAHTDEEEPLAPVSTIAALLVGIIGGFLAGLLAIGGGVVYVPAILRIFKRPMKVALATSLIVVMAVSIPGTIKHAMLGHIDWQMAALISIGAFPSAFFGAKLALKLRNRTLEWIFGICTITFGVYFFFSQL
jgi:uncharacterized membrane protein YfcA